MHRDALLSANDSALLAAHPPVAKNLEDDELNAEALERAYELVRDSGGEGRMLAESATGRRQRGVHRDSLQLYALGATLQRT